MRRLIEQLRASVDAFVEQRDDLALLLGSSDDDAALALKVVRDVEMAAESDLFLLSGDVFHTADQFVAAAVLYLHEQHALASAALVEASKPALRPFPDELLRATNPAPWRLREAICFARTLVPPGGGHRLVWAMVPMEVRDPGAYLDLLATLLPYRGIEPWMQGVRLIFRVHREPGGALPAVNVPRTRVEPVDFSPAAIQRSLDEEAEDATRPEAERMQALMTSAWLDGTQGRTKVALEKLQYLLGYYQQTENHTLQAIVMHGMGDVFRLQRDVERARHWYECALDAAVEGKAAVVIATVGWSLGALAYEGARFADAEGYYDGLNRIAEQLLDPEQKTRALEWRGLSQERGGSLPRAVASWEAACTLARSVGLTPYLRANLQHLERAWATLADDAKARAARVERESLPAAEAR